jgi:hypothetical protein
VIIEPAHTVEAPIIIPAYGNKFAVTVLAVVVNAPLVVSALPLSVVLESKMIAALLTIVPLKTELLPIVTEPTTIQNTFLACAPLTNLTFE